MARPRAATFEVQQAAIRDAATRVFADHGFLAATMAQVAGACGVSKPLVYHYYRDKEQLLFDIADGYIRRLLAIVDEVTQQGLAPEPHFRTLVARFMQEYRHSRERHMILVQDVKFLGADEHARVVAGQRRIVEAFVMAIAALRPRLSRAALRVPLAMILFGMINWMFTWLDADGPVKHEDMADIVSEVFLRGVLPADAGSSVKRAATRTRPSRAPTPKPR